MAYSQIRKWRDEIRLKQGHVGYQVHVPYYTAPSAIPSHCEAIDKQLSFLAYSLVMKLMHSETHSCIHSLASLETLPLCGMALRMVRATLCSGRNRSWRNKKGKRREICSAVHTIQSVFKNKVILTIFTFFVWKLFVRNLSEQGVLNKVKRQTC